MGMPLQKAAPNMGRKRQGLLHGCLKKEIFETMQIKLFTMPVFGGEQVEEEVNKFLRSHRVLQLERHFVADQGGYWAMLVEYTGGDPIAEAPPQGRRERKDVSVDMSDEVKERFNLYRDVRKELAGQRGIPPYLVFTNEELAILAHLPVVNEETIKGIKGIGPQRLKDYVGFFFNLESHAETSGQPDAADSESGESA